MKKALFGIVCLCIFAAACTTTARSGRWVFDILHQQMVFNDLEVEILSEPAGAKVLWDGAYIGDTPLKHKIKGKYDLHDFFTIKVLPNDPGQFVQEQVLHLNVVREQNRFPTRLFFNLKISGGGIKR